MRRQSHSFLLFATLFLVLYSSRVNCQRLRDMMYDSLYSGGVCFRRLNGTHQIGCSSKRGGSVGVVHAVSGIEDVNFITKNGTAGPYAAFLPIHLFTETLVDQLLEYSENIAGIIVYNNRTASDERIQAFTHEQRCPNINSQWMHSDSVCHNSDTDSNVWNPKGSGLMYRDFPFSIFYLPPDKQEDIDKIYNCYLKFNSFDLHSQSSRSLCAIEMDAFMFAAVSSHLCMRRSNIVKNLSPVRYCDPLADRSVFTTLFPRGTYSEKLNINKNATKDNLKLIKPLTEEEGSVILVTTQMDAASMLKDLGDGGVTTITGLVTLLATAQALGRMLPLSEFGNYSKNVMFVMLNGETFDYIGSQKMAADLAAGVFPQEGSDPVPPLKPTSIGLHIHISQLQNDNEKLFAFVPNYNESEKNDMVSNFVKSLEDEQIYGIPTVIKGSIPPSSVHSFMRFLNSSSIKMASVVLASHAKNFKNKYYQSVLDNKEYLQFKYENKSLEVKRDGSEVSFPDADYYLNSIQVRLSNISTALAKALYLQVTNKVYAGNISASPFIVDELLHCYLETIDCRLTTVSQSPDIPSVDLPMTVPPLSLYVGVTMWSPVVRATALFAAFLTGTNVSRSKDDCDRLDNEAVSYDWVAGWFNDGVCIRSITNKTLAISPAFMDEDYDYSSGVYSSWTESVWDSISLRILVKPARWREGLTMGIGCAIFVLSIISVLLGKRHVVWLNNNNLSENRTNISAQPVSRVDC